MQTIKLCSKYYKYTGAPEGKLSIVRGHSIGQSKQKEKLYIYMYPIPNGFQDETMDVITRIKERQDALKRATRHVTRITKSFDVDSGIFENVL
jgi:hypothetical protein